MQTLTLALAIAFLGAGLAQADAGRYPVGHPRCPHYSHPGCLKQDSARFRRWVPSVRSCRILGGQPADDHNCRGNAGRFNSVCCVKF